MENKEKQKARIEQHASEGTEVYSKEFFRRAGRLGAQATHRERYDALVELSKYCDKTFQNRIVKWSTKDILALLKFVRGMRKTK